VRLNPDVPSELERIINKALEKDRDVRYQSASDLRADLKRLKRDTTSGKIEAQPVQMRTRKLMWQGIAAVALMILVGAGMFVWLTSSSPQPRILATTQLTRDGLPKMNVVTDGSRLYITEIGPNYHIVQASSAGGETSPLSIPFANDEARDISADHTQLLIFSFLGTELEDPGWILPLPSGAPRRLGDVLAHAVAWSPDNRHLAFARASDIFQANADGSDPHKLTTVSGLPQDIRFSPDGTRIRFTVEGNDRSSSALWEIRSDGSNLHPLLPGWHTPEAEYRGDWTPDGRYFFFVSRAPSGDNIWALRESAGLFHRSSQPFQLTAGPMSFHFLRPSPDGKKLFVGASQGRAELVRYDSRSSQFVPFLSGISAGELDFSRDG
jgi:dipeptidyl aminopeptidase/acylaminoacyl peptidase